MGSSGNKQGEETELSEAELKDRTVFKKIIPFPLTHCASALPFSFHSAACLQGASIPCNGRKHGPDPGIVGTDPVTQKRMMLCIPPNNELFCSFPPILLFYILFLTQKALEMGPSC